MDFSKYSGMELIRIYGELLSKMREDELVVYISPNTAIHINTMSGLKKGCV